MPKPTLRASHLKFLVTSSTCHFSDCQCVVLVLLYLVIKDNWEQNYTLIIKWGQL